MNVDSPSENHDDEPAVLKSTTDRNLEAMEQELQRTKELLQRAKEDLIEAKRATEQANAVRDQFLAHVSHELRTPLSALLLWAKLLREHSQVPPALTEGLTAIQECAREQQALIEDIVDTSRMAAGKLRLEPKMIDLAALVGSAVEKVRPSALTALITLTEIYSPDVGLVSADPRRLYQVVRNLLTHALKFTSAGGRIDLRLERRNDAVILEVTDTGSGIPRDLLPHIFERFLPSGNVMTRSHSGLGFGLALVGQLVELHGGTVAVESEGVDRGSRFTVTLPLPALSPGAAAALDGAARPAGRGT